MESKVIDRSLFQEARQAIREEKKVPLSDAAKLFVKAEIEYRFMLQLCFMRPYHNEFKDKGYQIAWLRPSVVNRLSEMEKNIETLRINAFGSKI